MGSWFRAVGASALLLFSLPAHPASLTIKPTTTLSAETSNNTSAASFFTEQSNGNAAAGNVSKQNIHSLLYPGATTKVYAHLLGWFGGTQHMNVGYSSADATQVHRQIADMVERGIDGVIIDWYGQGDPSDTTAQLVKAEAEAHPGFTFAIMVDQGAIQWHSCSGCTPQQALTAHMQYVEQNYFSSPAYLRWWGLPMVTNFAIDESYSIDWAALRAALPSQPTFVFQNASGFSHALSGGGYAWIMPTTSDLGVGYLDDFYAAGTAHSNIYTVGATYKGFNDTLAGWSMNRVMPQNCGQTWLQTFSTINSLYSTANPLPVLQLVTWNDYEEATEIESGIDNCVAVSASETSGTLQWSISGNENTVDHYVVYASTDGQNLMPLTQVGTGNYSVGLCSFGFDTGTYTMYVQAVGKASIRNQMSGPVSYTARCSAAPPTTTASGISLAVAPTSMTLSSGNSGKAQVTVTPLGGAINDPVALTCSLPSGMSCTISPASVTPGISAVNSTITVSIPSSFLARSVPASHRPLQSPFWWSLGVAGAVFLGGGKRRRMRAAIGLAVAIGAIVLFTACGGGSSQSSSSTSINGQRTSHSAYRVTVRAQSGSVQSSTDFALTVQ